MIDLMGHEIKPPSAESNVGTDFSSEARSKRQTLTGWRKSLP